MKKALFPLMALVLVLGLALVPPLVSSTSPAWSVSADEDNSWVCLEDIGPGRRVVLSDRGYAWAKLFHLSVDGESYNGWCINLDRHIKVGLCFDADLLSAPRETPWCEIGYIMTNYSSTTDNEAAAIQLAIWKYVYGGRESVIAISPEEVETRALEIYDEAEGQCPNVIGGDSKLTLQPDGDTVVTGDLARQKFTATVADTTPSGDLPLGGIQIQFQTSNGSFSPDSAIILETVSTDVEGKASVTLYWDASQSSFGAILTAHTEGDWPVIIQPTRLIQDTIILKPFELTATEYKVWKPKLGSLEITKYIDWNGATPDPDQEFTICITGPSYLTPDCKTATYDGEVLTWDNLIPGDYNVTETDPGTEWSVVITGSPATVVAGDKTSANVTNTYGPGSLNVTKNIEWGEVTSFNSTFEICIEGPSYPEGNCQNATYDGQVLTWDNLIPGDYNVTETDPGTEWFVVITGSPATVVSLETASANVTNTYGPGSLNVTKNIEWGEVTSFNSTFEICIQGPSYPEGNCQNATYDGQVLTWDNLIPGSYNITETDAGKEWTVDVEPENVTVASNETASANVTNTYGPGSLNVTKNIEWGDVASFNATFEICIEGPSWPEGNCQNATYDGQVLTWENLIPGVYNITETDPGSQWTVVKSENVTVASNETASANVTNTYGPGSLNVTKNIEWGDVASFNSTFEICIQGPSYPEGNCQNATYDGQVLTWENLIPGSYNVTETDPGNEWSVDITGGSPATVVTGGTASANVTNTPCLGSIQIEKRDKDTEELLPGATFTISPDPYGGPDPLTVVDNDANDANKANGIILLDNVPCGTYTITEIAAPQGYQLDSTPQTVEVSSIVTVVFHNSSSPPSIKVDKTAVVCEGGEGCTPGYWKVPQHFADWPEGYNTDDTVGDLFDIPTCVEELADDTLLEALVKDTSGEAASTLVGGAQILLRQAVAAVLNAASPSVDYPRTVDGIVNEVNDALATCDRDTMLSLAGELDMYNNLGCPLNGDQGEGTSSSPPCPGCPGQDPLNVSIGDVVTYCYNVTNTGDVTLTDVTLVDDMGTSSDTSDDKPVTLGTNTLAPGESTQGELPYVVVAGDAPSRTNNATATGTPLGAENVTATDTDDCIIILATNVTACVGLTPDFWMNWDSYYTQEQFPQLLNGTWVPTIEGANFFFALYAAPFDIELINPGAHLLATQLTLNLVNMPGMPNPDDANLTLEDCQVEWNNETWTVGEAVQEALDILKHPGDYTRKQILKIKDILDMINNLGD